MRRFVLLAVLAGGLTVPGLAVAESIVAGDSPPALAVEADPDRAPPGPDPRLEGQFRPPEYGPNWTWWLGAALAGFTALAVIGVAAGYWFLVELPRRREPPGAS